MRIAGFLSYSDKFDLFDFHLRLLFPENITQFPSPFYLFATNRSASFSIFNDSIIYSVLLKTPETWIVQQKQAEVDLDNILSREMSPGQFFDIFSRINLIIEGSATTVFEDYLNGIFLSLYQ
jgi:hypothetical protein